MITINKSPNNEEIIKLLVIWIEIILHSHQKFLSLYTTFGDLDPIVQARATL